MTDEESFQSALDERPDDHQLRTFFADWLDEQGDPRAAGYRALGANKRYPIISTYETFISGSWWHLGDTDKGHNNLPEDWFELLTPSNLRRDNFWPTLDRKNLKVRRECENAAALAFTRLSPARQAELLSPLTVSAS